MVGLATTTLLLAGCATETRFRPATGHGFDRAGYSERQIEPNRYLVNFAGNSVTSRDTVERYLFFRAAQLTLEKGYDYFVTVDRDTDRQTQTYTTGSIGGAGYGYGGLGAGWGPSWRYYGRFGGRGPAWGGWGAWGGGFNDFDIHTVDRFEATAQVVMRRGPIPQNNIRAFDARQIVSTLGPTVQLPADRR
ncbi:CC0125/CC1285 family lipoprotein [Sphingomonas nostoxanthinifaciens]|uniref:CC0125/CC1285 family lipoprotein n=1 Tax=Sphingomonas nostoxanthinifaciens TaxID=2872652 RepID=UPI001CC1C6B2|nr:hypothetical protein [Sphingomonas nostoxanthinifaciens]UAK23837.1 hypothetical protein K8P63_15880 [Sphingomonas nostoxanthinifaciens]